MTRQIIWVTPKFPLPADDGARIATCSLIRGLTSRGETIELVAVAGKEEVCDVDRAKRELGVATAIVVRRGSTPKSKLLFGLELLRAILQQPLVPLTMRHFSSRLVRNVLGMAMAQIARPGPLYIVYDGLHPAISSSINGKFVPIKGAKVIYRAHNREASIWERSSAQAGFIKGLLLRYQARRVRIFEQSLLEKCDGLATVSSEDLDALKLECPGVKAKVVPIGYEFISPLPFASTNTTNIMFIGRLDWPPNRDGLIWFLNKVWPSVVLKCPKLRLSIAGSGNGEFLGAYSHDKSIDFLGRIESTQALYAKSLLSIVPVFYGSGTRVKAIEACRYGRACLSTEIGVEGIGLTSGKTYYHAETEAEWIRTLVNLDQNDAIRVGGLAFEEAKSKFDVGLAARSFQELF